MAEKKSAAKVEAAAGGRWAVFEDHAASWFGSEEDARAHVAELLAHRSGEGSAPVVAKAV